MKSFFDTLYSLPKGILDLLVEILYFIVFVFFGTLYKVSKKKESNPGYKISFAVLAAEMLTSLFIAFIVFAVFDQFFHFNRLFTYAMCSFAGSKSGIVDTKLEGLINNALDWVIKLKTKL